MAEKDASYKLFGQVFNKLFSIHDQHVSQVFPTERYGATEAHMAHFIGTAFGSDGPSDQGDLYRMRMQIYKQIICISILLLIILSKRYKVPVFLKQLLIRLLSIFQVIVDTLFKIEQHSEKHLFLFASLGTKLRRFFSCSYSSCT